MTLQKSFFLGLVLLALAFPGVGTGQTPMQSGYHQPEYDPETKLYGYPSLGIKPQFPHALPFSEDGLARVIVGCRYAKCKKRSPGYNPMKKRVWAFIDKSFNKEPDSYDVFDPKNYAIYDERFTFANSFSKEHPGLAKVKLANDPKSYYIDTHGEVQFVETKNGLAYIGGTIEETDRWNSLCEAEDKISCLDLDVLDKK